MDDIPISIATVAHDLQNLASVLDCGAVTPEGELLRKRIAIDIANLRSNEQQHGDADHPRGTSTKARRKATPPNSGLTQYLAETERSVLDVQPTRECADRLRNLSAALGEHGGDHAADPSDRKPMARRANKPRPFLADGEKRRLYGRQFNAVADELHQLSDIADQRTRWFTEKDITERAGQLIIDAVNDGYLDEIPLLRDLAAWADGRGRHPYEQIGGNARLVAGPTNLLHQTIGGGMVSVRCEGDDKATLTSDRRGGLLAIAFPQFFRPRHALLDSLNPQAGDSNVHRQRDIAYQDDRRVVACKLLASLIEQQPMSSASSTERQLPPGGPTRFWDALKFRAASAAVLGQELNTSADTVMQWKRTLLNAGFDIQRTSKIGYYRPDAPPPDFGGGEPEST